jgi:hypothetical protein
MSTGRCWIAARTSWASIIAGSLIASLTVSSTLVGSDIEQAGQHVRDFAFTSIAQKTLDKGWSLTGLLIHYGEDFEINDAGYLGRNDLNYGQFEVGKRITDLPADSAWSSHNLRFRIEGMQNNDRLWLQRQFRFNGNSQRRGGGNLNWNLQLRTAAFDDEITRGHGPMRVRNGGNAFIGRNFPRRGNWEFGVEGSIGVASGLRQDTPYAWSASASSTYYINDALNIELWLGHVMDQEQLIWQGRDLGPGYENVVVAGFHMNRYDLSASLNWNIGTRQELRVKLEALGFDADDPIAWRLGSGRPRRGQQRPGAALQPAQHGLPGALPLRARAAVEPVCRLRTRRLRLRPVRRRRLPPVQRCLQPAQRRTAGGQAGLSLRVVSGAVNPRLRAAS